jgi:hypothetical protein
MINVPTNCKLIWEAFHILFWLTVQLKLQYQLNLELIKEILRPLNPHLKAFKIVSLHSVF